MMTVEEDGINTCTSTADGDSDDSSLVPSSLSLPPDQRYLHNDDEGDDDDEGSLMIPLMLNPTDEFDTNSIRSRNRKVQSQEQEEHTPQHQQNRRVLRRNPNERRYAHIMNFLARLLFWSSVLALVAVVIWYSYELKNNGKDPHLIAWFSAGAFVLLGFPISMYGIVMHLANYNQPNIQLYIIRILWLVPIYSTESWLCLRYHQYAIYIETLRDFYESYVLYSFLQFLIQVLGGEEELTLMLKDKSPTRGVHMWGLQYCLRPWLMGQPVSRSVIISSPSSSISSSTQISSSSSSMALANNNTGNNNSKSNAAMTNINTATTTTTKITTIASSTTTIKTGGIKNATNKKHVQWTSPFFVKCKFGVLQYVLLKFVLSFVVMILELNGLYKEGDFTPKKGYLYICFLTNVSQCWALYCLIFFYFATVTELSPIRPVGKFLSVKAIVFFTWWQSVCISMIYQANLIPHYHGEGQDESTWTPEDVAKGMQDYLICIEMFIASLVHFFVFPHTDYLPQAVQARSAQHLATYTQQYSNQRRVGRLHNPVSAYGWLYTSNLHQGKDFDDRSKNSNSASGVELPSVEENTQHTGNMGNAAAVASHVMEIQPQQQQQHLQTSTTTSGTTSTTTLRPPPSTMGIHHDPTGAILETSKQHHSSIEEGCIEQQLPPKTGFLNALIDSTLNIAIPRDILQNSAGLIKGDYVVEKKTLLHHATTSDTYDLFSSSTAISNNTNEKQTNAPPKPKKTPKQQR